MIHEIIKILRLREKYKLIPTSAPPPAPPRLLTPSYRLLTPCYREYRDARTHLKTKG